MLNNCSDVIVIYYVDLVLFRNRVNSRFREDCRHSMIDITEV